MPLPIMKSGTGKVLGVYRLAGYTCMLIQNPEAIGVIKYFFMLVVTKDASQSPTMVVSCEENLLQEEMIKSVAEYVSKNGPKIFFCYFDVEGTHFNVEPLYEVPNAETFKLKAFTLIASTLGVSNEPELVQQLPKKQKEKVNIGGRKNIFFTILFVLLAFSSYLYLNQPKNLDDCIFDGLKGVGSDFAARQITWACGRKFPKHPREIIFNGVAHEFPSEMTNKQISEILIETYGATDAQVSEALVKEKLK